MSNGQKAVGSVDTHISSPGAEDAARVSRLLHDAFEPPFRPYIALAQAGAREFLALKFTHPTPHEVTLIARAGGTVVGYADFRLSTESRAFLSYICVDSQWRGKGVARALLSAFDERYPLVSHIELDVFESNDGAKALYRSIGFSKASQGYWVTSPAPSSRAGALYIGLHNTIAAHDRFGFAELEVDVDGGRRRYGLLGDRVVRCTKLDDFLDDRALSLAIAAFPKVDTVFAVVTESDLPRALKKAGSAVANTSERWTKSVTAQDRGAIHE